MFVLSTLSTVCFCPLLAKDYLKAFLDWNVKYVRNRKTLQNLCHVLTFLLLSGNTNEKGCDAKSEMRSNSLAGRVLSASLLIANELFL